MYGSRPLSKLEAALYIVVVSVLVLVLLDRAWLQFAYAERAAVEATLLRTQSALHTRLAYDLMRGRAADPEAWLAQNPITLARVALTNYAGERDAGAPVTQEPGTWIYDRTTHELVYLPRYPRGLSIEGDGSALRFRLSAAGPEGMPRLVPVSRYLWEP